MNACRFLVEIIEAATAEARYSDLRISDIEDIVLLILCKREHPAPPIERVIELAERFHTLQVQVGIDYLVKGEVIPRPADRRSRLMKAVNIVTDDCPCRVRPVTNAQPPHTSMCMVKADVVIARYDHDPFAIAA